MSDADTGATVLPAKAQRPLASRNGVAAGRAEIPAMTARVLHESFAALLASGRRLVALSVLPGAPGADSPVEILAALCDDREGALELARMQLPADGGGYPSLTAAAPQAQALERELFELHGIRPLGHPWLKPLRRHAALERGQTPAHPFFRVDGPSIHEVAVGPVHAGVIEPGHFRFQCHGETVLHLEIHLGYQHRGAEELFMRSSPARRLQIAESIAGDTAIGHATAYCCALEVLAGVEPPLVAQVLRGIALELERLANHAGDLGALCNDVGYLPGASWFGRLRGEFLNMLMELSGNRFGRGLVIPGGVRFGLDASQRASMLRRLERAERDLRSTAELTFDTPSLMSRFEETGVLSAEQANRLGLVGPAARASGCARDVRQDHPWGIYRFAHIPVARVDSGDVLGRAMVRWIETQRSLTFVREQLAELPGGPLASPLGGLRPGALTVALVEGWRGEIAHVASTGPGGQLDGYKFYDPSIHNWFGLAQAMRGGQISDFPLCNKSFNLSYAGHDL